MPEFLELLPPTEALEKFLDALPANVEAERIAVAQALGRVTAAPILAPHPLPEFRRSTVDGYAVRAANTHGASESLPVYLALKAEVPMGASPLFSVDNLACALIHTGGMLPPGTDAVIMVENTQSARPGEVEILRSVAVGENVIEIGEDVALGKEVISQGTRLRAAELGGLMALGKTEVLVACRPRVGILSSGDEVVPPSEKPAPGQVRDVNTYTLSALVENTGGIPVQYGIVSDNREAMLSAIKKAGAECDLVIVTAGSSASARDLTAEVMDAQGEPGVLVHGVNVRPGKPTILAVAGERAFIGLPGNPASALIIARLFVIPTLRAMLGLPQERIQPAVFAQLTINLSSKSGREDWIPVRLHTSATGEYLAEPIFGKSNLIFTLAQAHGLVCIPADANGLDAKEKVAVQLF
ncbi:MAG: molybdopterin molybdenumtransferase MoeA [Anaerolineaceae bacterium 4572_5.1]|nr:MAG: molybdopterin molybdenumtransferase MoeA [Anaerolineaceae bacterium 4572_5.1]